MSYLDIFLQVIKKITKFILEMPFYILAIVIIIFIRLINPFIKIKIGFIRTHAFGNHIFSIFYYILKKQISKEKSIDLFFYTSRIIQNNYLHKLTQKNVYSSFFIKYLYVLNNLFSDRDKYIAFVDHDDHEGLFVDNKISFSFTDKENAIGQKYLKSKGLNISTNYACLFVRDSAYKKKTFPNINFKYHDYRDSDIDDYNKSIEYLIKNNIPVFRMGKIVEKKVSINHKKYIDYANDPKRNDLLDLWLIANSKFCITTGTGGCNFARILNIPMLFVNYLPIANLNTFSKCMTYPKKLYSSKLKRNLNLSEYFKYSYKYQKDYNSNNIEVINLSEDEILSVVIEFMEKLNNTWEKRKDEDLLQKKFWRNFDKYNYRNIKKIHKESQVSYIFLKGLE